MTSLTTALPPSRSLFVADRLLAIETQLGAGDFEGAVMAARAAAEAAPWDAHVLHAAGRLCELSDQNKEALDNWIHAAMIDDTMAASWSAIGTMLSRGVKIEQQHLIALLAFDRAHRADPEWLLPAWHMALLYHALGLMEAAESALKRCSYILKHFAHLPKNSGPVNLHNRAYMHLSLGHFEEGFRCYEYRLLDVSHQLNTRASTRPPISTPRWVKGMKTPESLAIFVEQGAGDMLMCLRYAQHLAMQGVKIVLEASHDLLEFMRFETQNLPITVIALDEPLPCSVEAYAWAMSLPGLCWPLVGEVKTGGFPPSGEAPKFVAFCWQGSRAHKSDRIRSCPPDTWLEISHLVRQAGLIPIALNPGEPTPSWLEDPPTPIRNFADSARVLRECAAVVSIDTSLVHLAGVLGVPTFAAVAALPDWRWGLRGQGAIRWYESVQLVRQPTIGDWNSVVADISTRLSELLHLSTSTAP